MKNHLFIRYILFLQICLSLSLCSFSQSFEWVKSVGGTKNELSNGITADKDLNVYVTGRFRDKVDFDSGIDTFFLDAGNHYDIFILKLDSTGEFVWAKQMGAVLRTDEAIDIVLDKSGNIYTTGTFVTGLADFDPDTGVYNIAYANLVGGSDDIFISKLDSNGKFVWAKGLGGRETDKSYSITLDNSGNVLTTGAFRVTSDFDPNAGVYNLTAAGSAATTDCFISKLDSNGNFLWAKRIGGTNNELGRSIVTDPKGNCYITGGFYGVIDFDPGSGVFNQGESGRYATFLLKLDSNGNFNWAKTLRYSTSSVGVEVVLDSDKNIIITGLYLDSIDANPDTSLTHMHYSNGMDEIFLTKLDSNGNYLWSHSFGGRENDVVKSMSVDNYSNIYIAGEFKDTIDFDPSNDTFILRSPNGISSFISKYDPDGNFLTSAHLGKGNFDNFSDARSMHIDSFNNVYATGAYTKTGDFDPTSDTFNITSKAFGDIYAVKLGQCDPVVYVDSIKSCNSYSWVNGLSYDTSNYIASYYQATPYECDTIFQLNLTIPEIDTIVQVNTDTLFANDTLATYQWMDCTTGKIISGDTNQTFVPTSNGDYAVILTKNGCIDTSRCFNMLPVGIDERVAKGRIAISPNPSNGMLKVYTYGMNKDEQGFIYNSVGKLVKSFKISNQSKMLNLTELSSGLYYISIGNQRFKVVLTE